jgi:hypothetical protein
MLSQVEHLRDDLERFWNTLGRFGTTVPHDKSDVTNYKTKTYNQNGRFRPLDPKKRPILSHLSHFFRLTLKFLKNRPCLYQTQAVS